MFNEFEPQTPVWRINDVTDFAKLLQKSKNKRKTIIRFFINSHETDTFHEHSDIGNINANILLQIDE